MVEIKENREDRGQFRGIEDNLEGIEDNLGGIEDSKG